MRLFSTILSAVSFVLMLFMGFYGLRSLARYEGLLHYTVGKPVVAKASGNGNTLDLEIDGRASGWISYKGQLTYMSIANPVKFESWVSWNYPADVPPATGPMLLGAEARLYRGLQGGSSVTRQELTDPILKVGWKLPYTYFTIPYLLLGVAFAILPIRWILGYRQSARWEREGRCVGCGGDITGVKGKCPRCGAPIEA